MVKIILGLIGPQDSVKNILETAASFTDVTIYSYPYSDRSDIDDIIRKHAGEVDQWMFSGQVPYYYALDQGLIKKEEGTYPPLYGASLLGTIVEASYALKEVLRSISIDTINEKELETTRRHFSLNDLQVHALPYEAYLPNEEIIEHHVTCYESGKTNVAFTCISAVQIALKEKGIPTFRIYPSHLSVYFTIQLLRERGTSSLYQRSQMALIGIEASSPMFETTNPYHTWKYRELDVKRLLLKMSDQVNGSFVPGGSGYYSVYTTRGEIERLIKGQEFFQLQKSAEAICSVKLRIGVGYGITAMDAEEHVQQALQVAREEEGQPIVLVNDVGNITHLVDKVDTFTYEVAKWTSPERKEQLKDVGPMTVAKLEALSKFYRQEEVTAQDVTKWLSTSERNARRILACLEDSNIATKANDNDRGQRGRPRNIYKLHF